MKNIRKVTFLAILGLAVASMAGSSNAAAQGYRPIPKNGTPCNELKAVTMDGDNRFTCQQVGDAKLWREQPIHVRINHADSVCGIGIIEIHYSSEILVGREWRVLPDDGYVGLQLHFIGNGAGKDGFWQEVNSGSSGEGVMRFDLGQGLPTWDLMRAVRTDGSEIASSGVMPVDECDKP